MRAAAGRLRPAAQPCHHAIVLAVGGAPVAQILVRNLDDRLKARLELRAKRNRRSMEAEVREILRNALKVEEPQRGLGSEIVASSSPIRPSSPREM